MRTNSIFKRGNTKYLKPSTYKRKKLAFSLHNLTVFEVKKGRPSHNPGIFNNQINLEDLVKDATTLHCFPIFQKLSLLILKNINEKHLKDNSNKIENINFWLEKNKSQHNFVRDYSQVEQIKLKNENKKKFLIFVEIFLDEENKCLGLNLSFLVLLKKIALQFIEDMDHFDMPESKRKPIEIIFENVKNALKKDISTEKEIKTYFGDTSLDSFLNNLEELRKFFVDNVSA